jgi:hypothetical protein
MLQACERVAAGSGRLQFVRVLMPWCRRKMYVLLPKFSPWIGRAGMIGSGFSWNCVACAVAVAMSVAVRRQRRPIETLDMFDRRCRSLSGSFSVKLCNRAEFQNAGVGWSWFWCGLRLRHGTSSPACPPSHVSHNHEGLLTPALLPHQYVDSAFLVVNLWLIYLCITTSILQGLGPTRNLQLHRRSSLNV